ncbi:MAG: ABC transporter permease [Candidatus Anstonellales archaeon]
MEIIRLEKVKKVYKIDSVEVVAVEDVSISIKQAEFVLIMGPSGSGKSTLLYLLGLLDKPTYGKYQLFNNDISNLSENQLAILRNKFFGFVFQNYNLLPRINALENTLLPLIYSDINHLKEENELKAKNLLTKLGLADRLYHKPTQLSGGQQQKVAIARALINSPQVILADEPTGNLDSKSAAEIIDIFKKLNSEGITIIMVTHEPELASIAKRIIKLKDGKIISDTYNVNSEHLYISINQSIIENKTKNLNRRFNYSKVYDYFSESQKSLLSNKTRTFLSILGVVVGVASLIAMLSLGQGAQQQVKKQISSLGANLLMVSPSIRRIGGVATETGALRGLTLEDLKAIKNLKEVEAVSPLVQGRAQVVYANRNWNTRIEGVSSEFQYLRNTFPQKGRFFNDEEVSLKAKVALVGEEVVKQLFSGKEPLGEFIKINRVYFKIIGILPRRGVVGWRNEDDRIVIPYTTAMFRLLGTEFINTINVKIKDEYTPEEVSDNIKKTILKLHRLPETKKELIDIQNTAEIQQTITETTKTFSFLLGSIAFISLLVGGIGIMNIMLVSVTERTREIGIRKSIGATNSDILVQFLIESVYICLIGGALGVIVGSSISFILSTFAKWNTKLTIYSIVLAFGFSTIIGIIFGLWPAKKASNLNPIEALRYE